LKAKNLEVTKMTQISIADLQTQSPQSLLSLHKDRKNRLIIRQITGGKAEGGCVPPKKLY
jgi:hypothetical protein